MLTHLLNPRCDELGETITPDVLVDSDGDEQGSSNWLVRIDSICANDGRNRGHLHARSTKSNDDDDFPWPFSLHADGGNDVADVHNDHVGNHCEETHLRLEYRQCCTLREVGMSFVLPHGYLHSS